MSAASQVLPAGLWHTRYRYLFFSRTLKDIAENFVSIAVVWLLIESGGDAVSTSLLFLCILLPQMLLSSVVTPLLSRGQLHRWMFASDLFRGLLVLLIPICFYLGSLPLWLFFLVASMESAIGAFYNPASVALLPRVTHSSQLQQANAFLQSSSQVVSLLGLAGAGALVTLLSASATLVIAAVVFVLSAFIILLARPDKEQHSAEAGSITTEKRPYHQRVGEGFRIVKKHKLIFGLAVFAIFLNLGSAPFLSLSAIFVAEDLGGDAATLTLLRASIALGALLMGLLLTRITIKRQGLLFVWAGIISGLAYLLVGLSPWLWMIVVSCFLFGVTQTAINVPEMMIVQTTVPQHQQAQVYGVLMTISFALLPFAIIAAGPLAAAYSSSMIIAAGGVLIVISGVLVYLFTPLAKLQLEDESSAALRDDRAGQLG
ncbi:MFS transporter [Brevibacillus humidisoli]|uniref:MFS transporter n=1 Tax=Brevibacillus humidisoli TaxID=2895522 RepID=UPI001E64F75F|nr:MFS transporter [Brevibacillus humidisoli]UFJ40821.1 MFS transporter [Brevibacillus humidisoli]